MPQKHKEHSRWWEPLVENFVKLALILDMSPTCPLNPASVAYLNSHLDCQVLHTCSLPLTDVSPASRAPSSGDTIDIWVGIALCCGVGCCGSLVPSSTTSSPWGARSNPSPTVTTQNVSRCSKHPRGFYLGCTFKSLGKLFKKTAMLGLRLT